MSETNKFEYVVVDSGAIIKGHGLNFHQLGNTVIVSLCTHLVNHNGYDTWHLIIVFILILYT